MFRDITPILLIAFGLVCFLLALRLELFAPIDEPIIFDRKNRKVYRIFRELHLNLKGLFKPWPQYCVAYDWDLLDVMHASKLTADRAAIAVDNGIVFLALKSKKDNTLIDYFEFGSNNNALNSINLPTVWEHARQFMEDNGPHLPAGEALAEPNLPPMGYFQAMRRYILGNNKTIGEAFDKQTGWCLFVTLIAPISIPIYLWFGGAFWLAHKTAKPVQWPQAVLNAIGKPLTEEALQNKTAAD